MTDRAWRGIGVIPKSGWRLSEAYREFDAEERFQITGHSYRGVAAVPGRRCAARGHQAGRVRGVWQGVHAAASAGSDHGFKRRRLRGVLTTTGGFCRRKSWRARDAGLTRGAGAWLRHAAAEESSKDAPDFSNWSCPLPLVGYPTIVMGHGGGGKLGNELVEHLFLPAFRNPALENLGDAAVLESGRRADWP